MNVKSQKAKPDAISSYYLRFPGIVGNSPDMVSVYGLIERITDSDSTVIITGESGTGKGLIARAIHDNSPRRSRPFVSINCGAIPENLLESELFGHVRGAFTGATASKIGKFEQAAGGSVFLDEIGDMSPELQVKLLRVLEEREVEPVGGSRSVSVDARIIAATHKNLDKEVQNGNFREDLYYRLYVIPISMPSLRCRKADIPLLIDYFMEKYNAKNHRNVTGVTEAALDALRNYAWPGNVRELKNIIERLVVVKGEGEIERRDLPEKIAATTPGRRTTIGMPDTDISDNGICLNTAVSEYEKALILKSLEKTQWVKKRAAKLLHLNRTTLVEKIKRYNLKKT